LCFDSPENGICLEVRFKGDPAKKNGGSKRK
jgi:hypothetical protein